MTTETVAHATLIPLWTVSIGLNPQATVNARELHEFLESRQDFSTWIKARISQYGFSENADFTVYQTAPQNCGALESASCRDPGPQGRIDYYLTLDMAKELAMVERNAKGKQARQYFLECERQARAAQKSMSPAEVLIYQGQLLLAIEQEQARQAAQLQAIQQQTDANTRQTESNTKQIQQIETAVDHFTILGWHRYAKLAGSLPLADAARMGKQATQFCKDHELEMGRVPDPRFGTVHTYPKWVLDELFATMQ